MKFESKYNNVLLFIHENAFYTSFANWRPFYPGANGGGGGGGGGGGVFMYQMWTLQSNARVKYRTSLSIMTLTVLVVKYVEDPGPALMSDDVDNGLCVKRSHVEHVTVVLSGNIDGHAGRNVGYMKLVRVWTNGVDGAHVVRSKQNESTTRYLGTDWRNTRKHCIALGARLISILDLFRSIYQINSKITLKMWSLPNKWGLKVNH